MNDWASLGVLMFGAGGTLWALRLVLRNKLITVASHNEHMTQWADQVKGLRERLKEQEETHRLERDRDRERVAVTIAEIRAGYEARLADRDARNQQMAVQLDRLWSSYTLTDEAYQQVTSGRIHEFGRALQTVAHILSESPLADRQIDAPPMVGQDDDRSGSPHGPVD